jgi:hypothetical protein
MIPQWAVYASTNGLFGTKRNFCHPTMAFEEAT